MKTDAERGADGLWLRTRRAERGYRSAEEARRAIQATGSYIAPSVYAEYESGRRRISDKHRPVLEAFWGPPPKAPLFPGAVDTERFVGALTAALEAQTRALVRLADSLDAAREEARLGRGETIDLLAGLASELQALRDAVGNGDAVAASSPVAPGR